MTCVNFYTDDKSVIGFKISGHCTNNHSDEIGKIVCASVSSAAYMTVNTITDVIFDKAVIKVDDAQMYLFVKNPSDFSRKLLDGFRLHIKSLSDEYSNNIKINGGAKYVKD